MHKLINHIVILATILFSTLYTTKLYALTFNIYYSQSIDFLNFMDKLSDWEPGPAANAYKMFWARNNLQKKDDYKFLSDYKEIRKKYYFSSRSSLFTENNPNKDIISASFYDYHHPKNALHHLKSKINHTDHQKLKKSTHYFSDRISKIIMNQPHNKAIKNLKKTLNENNIQNHIKAICHFYNVDFKKLHINIAINWTLEDVDEDAFINLDTIVLSDLYNKDETDNLKNADNLSILIHEIVHLVSSKAPTEQKRHLSEIFENSFKLTEKMSSQKKMYLLEEPLAVILGQMLFTRGFSPEYYEKCHHWYANSWVNTMAILKEPIVAHYLHENKPIDDKLIQSFAKKSIELSNISEWVN